MIRIEINTTYENVDEAWLHWWLTSLMLSSKEGSEQAFEVKNTGSSIFVSTDPTSQVKATTGIRVIRD